MPSGTPAAGGGASFGASFAIPGTYNATVTSGTQTAVCSAVISTVIQTPVCTPLTQNVSVGAPAIVTASLGDGTYSWAAPGGTPSSGSGTTLSPAYAAAGSYTITLTSAGLVSTCLVVVTDPQPLVCTPPTQTASIGQTANMSATGGTGTYAWSAPGGSTPTGSGAAFSTSYPASGSYTATVTSGTQSATCLVTVPTVPALVCAPPTQTVQIGQTASMSATGGTGTYAWSAPGGSTPTGSGAAFSTSYPAAGSYTATVTSGVQTAQCQVTVPPPQNSCAGTTGRFTDLTPLTLGAEVTVPVGQQSTIQIEVTDRATGVTTYLPTQTFGTGTHAWFFNTSCFVKVNIVCLSPGGGFLDRQDSTNACAAP